MFVYVRYAVSYRDLEEIPAERGVEVNQARFNRFIIRSRHRVGWREFLARLFKPLRDRCSTRGLMSRFVAQYERNLSVFMMYGAELGCLCITVTSDQHILCEAILIDRAPQRSRNSLKEILVVGPSIFSHVQKK